MAFLCFVCLGFFPLNVIYTVYLYVQYVLSKYYRLCKGHISFLQTYLLLDEKHFCADS